MENSYAKETLQSFHLESPFYFWFACRLSSLQQNIGAARQ
jgi:hypothetical protein